MFSQDWSVRRPAGSRPCARIAMGLAVTAAVGLLALEPAGATSPPPPRPADQVFDEAIVSLRSERDLVARAVEIGPPPPEALRREIQDADEHGVRLLGELRSVGFVPSVSVVDTLGPLPPAADGGPPALPTSDVYDVAIDELVTGATTAFGGPPATVQPPGRLDEAARPPAPASMSGLTIGLLVVAILLLSILVGLAATIVLRRRKDGRLVELAMTDSLTGLSKRRRLDDDLRTFASRTRTSVAILMVDVDNFKVFNDRHGHSTGDRILQRVGEVLERQVRSKDVVYRYGGEEFCVLLPNASREEALAIAERIRLTISQLDIPVSGFVTISVGVAIGAGADVFETLGHADAAMYDAKRDGRDRVALAGGVSR